MTTLWPVFAVLAILIAMTGGIVISSLSASPEIAKAMIEGHIVSRFVVICLVVPIVAILCIQERITGEAAVACLSSIAGYILGGASAGQ